MTAVVLLIVLAAMLIIVSSVSYRRRAGVAAGTGRGAPASPVLVGIIALLAVFGAIGIFILVQGR